MSEELKALLARLTAEPAQPQPPAADDRIGALTGMVEKLATVVEKMASRPMQPAPAKPTSDYGSLTGGAAPASHWKAELVERPFDMSAAARRQMDAELGAEPARRRRLEAAAAFAPHIKVVADPKAGK